MKDINVQLSEFEQTPNRINPQKSTPRHIAVKLLKTKNIRKILKAVRKEQHLTYDGKTIQMTEDFSSETMEKRRKEIFF